MNLKTYKNPDGTWSARRSIIFFGGRARPTRKDDHHSVWFRAQLNNIYFGFRITRKGKA